MTYAFLFLFTLVLYIRPNDVLPIGDFPAVKIIGLLALLAFLFEGPRLRPRTGPVPPEIKYLFGLIAAMLLSVPLAPSLAEALNTFLDIYVKIAMVFILATVVVSSYNRLRLLMALTVFCGTWIAYETLQDFHSGINLLGGYRASGIVKGMFENPNDLALSLSMLLPLAVGLALTSRSRLKALMYLGCVGVLILAVQATYSRAGMLSLMSVILYLLFALGRKHKASFVALILLSVIAYSINPDLLGTRMVSILDPSWDISGSSTQRLDILTQVLGVLASNPKVMAVGVGAGNFQILSDVGKGAHNAYLQVLVELGLPAFVLYLLFLRATFTGLRPLAKSLRLTQSASPLAEMAVAIRGALIAYFVGSFFADVAYLWYVYYPAAYAICLRHLAPLSDGEVTPSASPQHGIRNIRR